MVRGAPRELSRNLFGEPLDETGAMDGMEAKIVCLLGYQ